MRVGLAGSERSATRFARLVVKLMLAAVVLHVGCELAEKSRLISPLTEAVLRFGIWSLLSIGLVYHAWQAFDSAAIRASAAGVAVLSSLGLLLGVFEDIDRLDQIPLIGRHGVHHSLVQKAVFSLQACATGLMLLTITMAIDDTNATLEDRIAERTSELEASDSRLKLALEHTRTSVWDIDVARDELVSPVLPHWLGYTHEDGAPDRDFWRSLIHPDDRHIPREAFDACVTGRTDSYECEYRVRAKNGDWCWTLDRGRVVSRQNDGRPARMIGSDTDITELKQAQASLAQAREELEERVAERTRDLSDAVESLRNESEERARVEAEREHFARLSELSQMVAAMAHELNQPLAAISNYASAAQVTLDNSRADQEEIARLATEISQQAWRAGEIIKRLRSLLKRAASVQVSIELLICEVVDLVREEIQLHDIRLILDLQEFSGVVTVDRIQIQQVLMNLVRNAIDAMKGMPQRELRIQTRQQQDGSVEIIVADSGSGMKGDVFDHIFEAFYTTKNEGMGVGLSISRSIVEAHGGAIWAKSTDAGAEFHFTIPEKSLRAG